MTKIYHVLLHGYLKDKTHLSTRGTSSTLPLTCVFGQFSGTFPLPVTVTITRVLQTPVLMPEQSVRFPRYSKCTALLAAILVF